MMWYHMKNISFVILHQLAKVDWAGVAEGLFSNLPEIIEAANYADEKVR